ncbi:hypothetical protein K435DRAFT_133899 [Dendrothele bispora CBS 962.96]|uniref:Uncharacterized protein n=1 Tax=Dendrothele bispora (strain CBS 962.96) TaxID=1314807 RepID=A0A4S8MQ58_DENBC|nr:hypothetical protein K435DRAFT_133899 [Dendrothele bispora CBS 962.96]
MTAPPPRPHPHISSSYFSAVNVADDDAWDSGSDGDSPAQSTHAFSSWPRPTAPTAPKAVPKPPDSPSSSTLSFSYTHVNAPNPSSYPPRTDQSQTPKNGWTIVRTSHPRRSSNETGSSNQDDTSDHVPELEADADVEGDMILGDLESEPSVDAASSMVSQKLKADQGSLREDAEEIVNGEYLSSLVSSHLFYPRN